MDLDQTLEPRIVYYFMISQQLLHKYTENHKKLYVGFIDYEKPLDSLWQSGMNRELHKYGIKGKFLNVIKSMYSSIMSCQLKLIKTRLPNFFHVTKG